MRFLALCLGGFVAATTSWWSVASTGAKTNLRGVCAVVRRSGTVLWTSGSNGVVLRSEDSGKNWERQEVEVGEGRDFRGLQSFDGQNAYLFSSGPGEKSRIYKTTDAGRTWQVQYTDPRKEFFLDALACREATDCFALSDPVGGKFVLLRTEDGTHWQELPRGPMPEALPGEGAFAASNSSLLLFGKTEIYFATGGAVARVFHSEDLGKSWTVETTPVRSGAPSEGIFSLVRAGDTVVVVGGDYLHPEGGEKIAAYSPDRGKTWHLAEQGPEGYRSSVDTYDAGFVTVGPSGAETSRDGNHWNPIGGPNLNAVVFIRGQGWAVGPEGLVAQFLDHTEYSTGE